MKDDILEARRSELLTPGLVDALEQVGPALLEGYQAGGSVLPFTPPQIHQLRHDLDYWMKQARAYLDGRAEQRAGDILSNLARLAVFGQEVAPLREYGVPFPTFNLLRTLSENIRGGPWGPPGAGQKLSPRSWQLLGFDVRFPVGVPASVLTASADFIEFFARHEFNILVTKTFRTEQWEGHDPPTWTFIPDAGQAYELGELPDVVRADALYYPKVFEPCSTANSYGVPSPPPFDWMNQVAKALGRIGLGQILIVSVMGTAETHPEKVEFIRDFVSAARSAEEAGAKAVELNLSCPNTRHSGARSPDVLLCEDIETATAVVKSVRDGLANSSTRLVLKLSYMKRPDLKRLLVDLAGEIDGVAGINTMQVNLLDQDDKPYFTGREPAGLSGAAIRNYGMRFVSNVAEIKDEFDLDIDILGVGGVFSTGDIMEYFRRGANAVMSATGALVDVSLAERAALEASSELLAEARSEARFSRDIDEQFVLKIVAEEREIDEYHLGVRVPISPAALGAVLNRLKEDGKIVVKTRNGVNTYRRARRGVLAHH
jgi:dihydroorotate dehydrogenase